MPHPFSKLWAKIVLAIHFLAHLIYRIFFFWKNDDGLNKFFKFYHRDGVYSVLKDERVEWPLYQKCQSCSLCTFSCEPIKLGQAPPSFEPKYIMLSASRSPHESEVFLENWLPCMECKSCTVLCPNDVDIHLMVERILERRKRILFRR